MPPPPSICSHFRLRFGLLSYPFPAPASCKNCFCFCSPMGSSCLSLLCAEVTGLYDHTSLLYSLSEDTKLNPKLVRKNELCASLDPDWTYIYWRWERWDRKNGTASSLKPTVGVTTKNNVVFPKGKLHGTIILPVKYKAVTCRAYDV